jgi:diguanylate cyclase (GGDEF)-like protein/PAS domain S-box-containing protein
LEVPAITEDVPRRIAIACGVIVCVLGILVFSGWVFDLQPLKQIRPSWPNMAPATALGFTLAGATLWLIAGAPGESLAPARLWTVRFMAVTTALFGASKLAFYGFGLPFDFDTFGFADSAYVPPATAADFLLVGCTLWLARPRQHFAIFQAFALASVLVGALGLASYLYGGSMLLPYAQMAIHTSPLFILLGVGILCTRTERGLMALLTSRTAGGWMALWMLMSVPLAPLAIGWLEQRAERTGWFGDADPNPLFALLDMIVLAALIWTAGAWLHRVDLKRAREQEARLEHQAQLGLFVEFAPAAIAMLDRCMRYIAVSRRWTQDFRLECQNVVGRSHYDIFPEISAPWKSVYRRCLAGGSEKREEDPFPRADGTLDWVHWDIHPWHRRTGEVGGLILFSEVVTERVRAAEKIRRLNRIYGVLSQINSLIVRARDRQVLFEEACRIAVEHGTFSLAWIGLFHADTNEIRPVASTGDAEIARASLPIDVSEGSPDAQSIPALALQSRRAVFDNDIALGRGTESDRYRELVAAGYRSVIALPLFVDNIATGVISMWTREMHFFDEGELRLLKELAGDISFAMQFLTKQEELDYISYFDILTGLANRTLFLDRLNQRLRADGREPGTVALLLCDIEHFAAVNNALSRYGADEVLQRTAERLRRAFGGKENLARIGADKFAVVLPDTNDATDIAQRIERVLLPCFNDPFNVAGIELRISARVGAAESPADGVDAETLLRSAEAAVKEAKASSSRYLFYAADMNVKAAESLSLEIRLRKAVEAREFVLYYQPKISLRDGSMSGLEALIRWQNPDTGLVQPGKFIPVLEQSGLIIEVGRWAVERALADFSEWTARSRRVPRIAVNLSAVQLRQEDFSAGIEDLIEASAVTPDALELEITETLIMRNIERSVRTLTALRGMGIHIAIDDFGTGYSSLSYLARLPIDKIKIDRSFVTAMLDSAQDRIVVSTIIALAHSFGLPVVAEGVETEEQATSLRELGCDEAQGYLFCKPLPAGEIGKLLTAI